MRTSGQTERRRVLTIALVLAAEALPGCGTVKTTGTTRSATEQLLLTNAWDSALQKIDFRAMAGVPVYLDTTNVTAVDQGWVVSSLRQSMLAQGVLLRQKAEQAQWVVEARVGAYGTDDYSLLIGIPQTTIPQTITGMPAGTIPELPLIKKSRQQGVAKLALFAYDRSSGQLVWNSGTMLAIATAKDIHVLGIGPIQSGSIRGRTEFEGIRLPVPSEGAPRDPYDKGGKTKPSVPFSNQELKQPSSLSDLDGFAP
jgi:hypothetical protein